MALMLGAHGGSPLPAEHQGTASSLPQLDHAPCRHIFPSKPLHVPCLHLSVALGLQGTKDQQPPPQLAAPRSCIPSNFTHLLSSG